VPTSSTSHDITVKGVENNLMSQLKRFVKVDKVLSLFDLQGITFFLGFRKFPSPNFDKCLEFISSISEVSDCINIE